MSRVDQLESIIVKEVHSIDDVSGEWQDPPAASPSPPGTAPSTVFITVTFDCSNEPTATATPPTQKPGIVRRLLPAPKDRVFTLEVIE